MVKIIEAKYYKKLDGKKVNCVLCPKNCIIVDGKRGFCKVRENKKGKLYSLVYGKPCSTAIDPIEKKPLFHFYPGTFAYSLSTAGCNFRCLFCQNWQISQSMPEDIPYKEMSPEEIVKDAIANNCKTIAYTYVEPSIFYEYVLDIAKIARKKGLKNVMITNGFINPEPLKELYKYIDAANVDLKGFTEEYYRKYCMGMLHPVLESMKLMKEMGVWIEITTLIIPTLNDDMRKIEEECKWIKENLGENVPLHFSRFFPMYKLNNILPTPEKTLQDACKIAKKYLKYVYIGNIELELSNTICPKCNEVLVERTRFFDVKKNIIRDGKCPKCKTKIAGVFD